MLNAERNLHPYPPRTDVLCRNSGEFPLPVLVWNETHSGEWESLTIFNPREALHAMNNGLGTKTDEGWHFVVGRLAVAVRDPRPNNLEQARHALAVYAARLGVLAG
jgi:hypothetical protein